MLKDCSREVPSVEVRRSGETFDHRVAIVSTCRSTTRQHLQLLVQVGSVIKSRVLTLISVAQAASPSPELPSSSSTSINPSTSPINLPDQPLRTQQLPRMRLPKLLFPNLWNHTASPNTSLSNSKTTQVVLVAAPGSSIHQDLKRNLRRRDMGRVPHFGRPGVEGSSSSPSGEAAKVQMRSWTSFGRKVKPGKVVSGCEGWAGGKSCHGGGRRGLVGVRRRHYGGLGAHDFICALWYGETKSWWFGRWSRGGLATLNFGTGSCGMLISMWSPE